MTKNIESLFEKTNYKAKINKKKKEDIRAILMMEAEKMNQKSKKINIFKFLSVTALSFAFSFIILNISTIWILNFDNTLKSDQNKKIERIAYKKYLWNNKSVNILDNNTEIKSQELLYKVRQNKKNFQKTNYLAYSNFNK